MANPTVLVSHFNDLTYASPSGAGSWTPTGAVRLYTGLYIEQAATNKQPNPTALTDATGWNALGSRTLTRVTALPGPLPGWLGTVVTTGFEAGTDIQRTAGFPTVAQDSLTLTAAAHIYGLWLWIPSNWTGGTAQLTQSGFTSVVGGTAASANMSLKGQWQFIGLTLTPDSGDLSGELNIGITGTGTWNLGETLTFAAVQVETGSVATSFAMSSLGTGYSASPSPHSRAVASAAATIAAPVSAACWYSEDGGAKTFAYLPSLGTIGTNGNVAHATGTLTLSTSKNLIVGPFAAFDRTLTDKEQTNLASTQSWNLNTVAGGSRIRSQFELRPAY